MSYFRNQEYWIALWVKESYERDRLARSQRLQADAESREMNSQNDRSQRDDQFQTLE